MKNEEIEVVLSPYSQKKREEFATKKAKKPAFIAGPLDLGWLLKALDCRYKHSVVVVLLLYYHSTNKNKHKPISIPTSKLEECGLTRKVYYQVINSLEASGLIETVRESGTKTKVKLLGLTGGN